MYSFVASVNRSGNKTLTNSSKSTKSFIKTDPNFSPKSYDKSSKVLPLSQNQNYSNSSPEKCAKCKRLFKTSEGLNQRTRLCKEKQVIDPKVTETTFSTVFPITNVTVDEENIWNADSDVMKNKLEDDIIRPFIGENHCFYYLPDVRADTFY